MNNLSLITKIINNLKDFIATVKSSGSLKQYLSLYLAFYFLVCFVLIFQTNPGSLDSLSQTLWLFFFPALTRFLGITSVFIVHVSLGILFVIYVFIIEFLLFHYLRKRNKIIAIVFLLLSWILTDYLKSILAYTYVYSGV